MELSFFTTIFHSVFGTYLLYVEKNTDYEMNLSGNKTPTKKLLINWIISFTSSQMNFITKKYIQPNYVPLPD